MSLSKAVEVISGINEFGSFFQLVKSVVSYLRSQWNNGVQEQQIQEHEVLQLQSDLRGLSETLPSMYNLIDRAEWRSHEKFVAELLPELKDAVYDVEDLLDELRWYELKGSIEGNSTQLSPLIEFFHNVTQGSFSKVNDIQKRLSDLSSHLEKTGLLEAIPRFDKSVRPVTTSFRIEPKIFGRETEMEEVVRLLGVPNYTSRHSSKRRRTCNAANNESRASVVPVLAIVGMGGVGKTTLAQEIITLQRVKSHFHKIIWICVSDEFDAERLTKVVIKSLSGKEATSDNFDDLQQDLIAKVAGKRFLLILDDIWPDALKEDGLCWKKFCAPLRNVLEGSMLLVTTRFAEVADTVRTTESFPLEGLKPEVFWDFFKLCVFGLEDCQIDSQLEMIGRSILPKLKGSPLAAKTIGRLLRKNLNPDHWSDILNSELWHLPQKETEILPALRLSYMYLPFHLKRCFSFCAVYPKDYNFQQGSLAEIWVAEGFVQPQGSIPLQRIGNQYFEDLVSLSFFQKHRGTYVIHDLMHDMAQLVSKNECFIVKNTSDYDKVPQNVRHLSILANSDVKFDNLFSLRKHTKLRTVLCNKSTRQKSLASVTNYWFREFRRLRVICFASLRELPESIGNLKHLRYLEIFMDCPFRSLPSSLCCLYNLQILYARRCMFESLPSGWSKLINLQKFEAHILAKEKTIEVDATDWVKNIGLLRTSNKVIIYNLGAISKDHAREMNIRKIVCPNFLTLKWPPLTSQGHNEIEVIQALCPPATLKSIHLNGYPGECLPSWFHSGQLICLEEITLSDCPNITLRGLFAPPLKKLELKNSGILGDIIECCSLTCMHLSSSNLTCIEMEKWNLPALQDLVITGCDSLTCIGVSNKSHHRGSGCSTGIVFSSLTDLTILNCSKLQNLDNLLSHEYLPSIKRICVDWCEELRFLGGEKIQSFLFLQDLEIGSCPRLNWESGMALPSSLQRLTLWRCGDFSAWFPRCLENLTSLLSLELSSCERVVAIPGNLWSSSLISLQELSIWNCPDLVSIGGPDAIANIEKVQITSCENLKEVHQPVWRGDS